jgi:hypothetical protein
VVAHACNLSTKEADFVSKNKNKNRKEKGAKVFTKYPGPSRGSFLLAVSLAGILLNADGASHFNSVISIVRFFFLWDWGLKSRLCTCKTHTFLHEPHLQSILLWLFWRWGLVNEFVLDGLEPPSC